MNYYIQGNKEKAEEIKAAFETKGYKCEHNCDSMNFLYYTINNHVTTTGIQSHTRQLIMRLAELGDYSELELPKPHYDIKNFHAGMPVLVRDYDNGRWSYAQFSHYVEECRMKFNACGIPYIQCIPFEGNEHLLGTTDMCPEEYINW